MVTLRYSRVCPREVGHAKRRRSRRQLVMRPAETNEWEALYGILLERSAWLRARAIDQWNPPYPVERFRREVEQGEVSVFEFERLLVGTVTLGDSRPDYYPPEIWPGDETARYLSRFAMSLDVAGQGLGSAGLAVVEGEAAVAGRSALRLDVVRSNPFLEPYYARHGFRVVAEGEYFGTPAVFMEKRILRKGRNPT